MASRPVYIELCAVLEVSMTHWTEHYLKARYRDGARDWAGAEYDCWSMTREARYLHLGKRLLPSWGDVRHSSPKDFTRAYEAEARGMEACEPEIGAIATVFRGRIVIHVALVFEADGRLCCLEINPAGAGIMRISDFERKYNKVTYYRDQTLPEQVT